MKVMVVGGAGSIGSELVERLYGSREVVAVDISEEGLFNLKYAKGEIGDIKDYRRIDELITKYNPSLIYNAAAYKHVPAIEGSPIEAVKTNIMGLNILCLIAYKHGKDLINISTDKAVNPKSIMGMTKRIGERVVADYGFMSLRLCNVIGSSGSLYPIIKKQIEAGGPVTLTHKDMERYFISKKKAAELLISINRILDKRPGVFAIDTASMAPVKILDVIKKLIYPKKIEIKESPNV